MVDAVPLLTRRGQSAAEVQELIDAAIADALEASLGGGQFDRIETFPSILSAAESVLISGASYFVLVRSFKPLSVGHIDIGIGSVTSGNVDVGVFSFDGTTYTKLASSGSTPMGIADTVQRLTLTTPVAVTPGVTYALALAIDNEMAKLDVVIPWANAMSAYAKTDGWVAAYPLPASQSWAGLTATSRVPWIAGVA